MRSISLNSGAFWEFLEAFELKMAVFSTIPPQYGWVLITLILSILV